VGDHSPYADYSAGSVSTKKNHAGDMPFRGFDESNSVPEDGWRRGFLSFPCLGPDEAERCQSEPRHPKAAARSFTLNNPH